MKDVVERLSKDEFLCCSLESIEPKELGSRKRVKLFFGTGDDSYYCFVVKVSQKSRVLVKDAEVFVELLERLKSLKGVNIKRKFLILKAPICSKALRFLEEEGWIVKFTPFESFEVRK